MINVPVVHTSRCKDESNIIPHYDTGCRISKMMHDATVEQPLSTVYPNSNSTKVVTNTMPFGYRTPLFNTPL